MISQSALFLNGLGLFIGFGLSAIVFQLWKRPSASPSSREMQRLEMEKQELQMQWEENHALLNSLTDRIRELERTLIQERRERLAEQAELESLRFEKGSLVGIGQKKTRPRF